MKILYFYIRDATRFFLRTICRHNFLFGCWRLINYKYLVIRYNRKYVQLSKNTFKSRNIFKVWKLYCSNLVFFFSLSFRIQHKISLRIQCHTHLYRGSICCNLVYQRNDEKSENISLNIQFILWWVNPIQVLRAKPIINYAIDGQFQKSPLSCFCQFTQVASNSLRIRS